MYLIAACLVMAFCLNWWNLVMGPESAGYARLSRLSLQVGEVVPEGPFDKAGVRNGDMLLAVDGQKLQSVLDWDFIRTTFESGKPFTLDVRRGQETLHLTVILQQRKFQRWDTGDYVSTFSIAFAQAMLLALALLIVFIRPYDLSAWLAAWLLGSIAVFIPPTYGIAALLRHLPVPIGMRSEERRVGKECRL